MSSNVSIAHPRLGSVLSWVIEQQPDSDLLKQRLRQTLGGVGVSDKHLRGMVALTANACIGVAKRLPNAKERTRLLRAADVIGRSGCPDGKMTFKTLSGLANVLNSTEAHQIHIDSLARLVKEWLSGPHAMEFDVLSDIITWAAGQGSVPKLGGWESIILARLTALTFVSPAGFPSRIGKVEVAQLVNGKDLNAEGNRMKHCLSNPIFAYQHATSAAAGYEVLFHLSEIGNPVNCATLAIKLEDDNWEIIEFETVGRGSPTSILNSAAKGLVEYL